MGKEQKTVVKQLEDMFACHPHAKEIYEDERGVFWLSKETAKNQSKQTGMVTTHKQSDYTNKK